jgi:hypothetical protein
MKECSWFQAGHATEWFSSVVASRGSSEPPEDVFACVTLATNTALKVVEFGIKALLASVCFPVWVLATCAINKKFCVSHLLFARITERWQPSDSLPVALASFLITAQIRLVLLAYLRPLCVSHKSTLSVVTTKTNLPHAPLF